ncbi:hypothetical protein EI94DRAFT_1701854 [Lactarius quietus]|nr:hypothetical protein EI94DRAFT_1701854 [Lactarius quietus]
MVSGRPRYTIPQSRQATTDGQTFSEDLLIPTLNISPAALDPEVLSNSLRDEYADQDNNMVDFDLQDVISSNTVEAIDEAAYLNADDDTEDKDNLIAGHDAQDKNAMEHWCSRCPSPVAVPCPNPMTMDMDISHTSEDKDLPQVNDPLPNPGEVKLDLEEHPIVTIYPGGMAGIIHSKAKLSENKQYALKIGSQSEANIYTPFASALEWEVARFKIDEHLGLSFKNAWELNQMINTHLPGQPPIQQREILVGNGVCKVYFQDILQCIHTLFGNPDFEPHLIFAPEEHYANEDKQRGSTTTCIQGHGGGRCSAGKDGEFMSTAASDVHQTHPILASFIGNYPEQVTAPGVAQLMTILVTSDPAMCMTLTAWMKHSLCSTHSTLTQHNSFKHHLKSAPSQCPIHFG